MFGDSVFEDMKRTFEKNHGRPAKLKDLQSLMDAIAKAAGFGSPGE